MNKASFTKFIKDAQKVISKRSPEILTGLGIAGMVTTTVLAVQATPKAIRLLEEKKEELHLESDEKLKPIEVVKTAWKPYIPATVMGIASIGCLIGASSVSARRNAALATAYQLSTTALAEYKDKVVETIGEEKEKVIREKVAQDKIDNHPVKEKEVVVIGSGEVLFLEPVSMQCFKSDIESVRKILNDINYRLTSGTEEYISLSEFYDEIGLPHTAISDDIGWNLGRDGQLQADFLAAKTTDGKPCLMLDYMVKPRYDYYRLM